MNNHQIESEINAKGLTAPRVTMADIESNIVGEAFFYCEAGRDGGRHYQLQSAACSAGMSDPMRADAAKRLHCYRRVGLRQSGELRRRAGTQDRASKRGSKDLAADGLCAA